MNQFNQLLQIDIKVLFCQLLFCGKSNGYNVSGSQYSDKASNYHVALPQTLMNQINPTKLQKDQENKESQQLQTQPATTITMQKRKYFEQKQTCSSKQNIPITFKNNERGRNTFNEPNASRDSIDSPIQGLRLSREQQIQSNPQMVDGEKVSSSIVKDQFKRNDQEFQKGSQIGQVKSKQHIAREGINDQKSDKDNEEEDKEKEKKKEENLCKIKLGDEKVIELPVIKASPESEFQQDQDLIDEMASQVSQPHELPQSIKLSPKAEQEKVYDFNKKPPFDERQKPQRQMKRSVSQIPSNLHFSLLNRFKSKRPEYHPSRSITDSIMSPQFEKHLGQSRKHHRSKLPSPLFVHKHNHNHHNQALTMTQSDTLSKNNNIYYRTTFIRQQLKLTLANNLDKILFKYNGGHARVLYNNKLKIKNDSPVDVDVKILCTSPSHYEVRPLAEMTLCPSEIMNVIIQMKLSMHELDHVTMKHDLTRYKNDRFKICYWSTDYSTDVWYEQGEKVLPVVIEDTEEERVRDKGMIHSRNNQEMKIIDGEKNIEMYRKMIQQTNAKIELIEQRARKLREKQSYVRYFTKGLFWMVIIIGFAFGYWLG